MKKEKKKIKKKSKAWQRVNHLMGSAAGNDGEDKSEDNDDAGSN